MLFSVLILACFCFPTFCARAFFKSSSAFCQVAFSLLSVLNHSLTERENAVSRAIDFTQGSIQKNLLAFAFPLFLGNLFQQLYNAADSLIVGNWLGSEALAAVSSSSPLINMMVGFFNGLAIGAGVVISRAFGARDYKALDRAIHTDLAFSAAAGIVMTVLGSLFTPTILGWMQTPEDIMPNSIAYFRVYCLGIIFSLLYNTCMGIMNALGDSRHPLYYLIISSLTNVILDIIFVAGFGLGTGSAALATIISQALSVILSLKRLFRGQEGLYKVELRKIRFHMGSLKEILRFGLPSGVQNSVIGFANIVVQTNINSFASSAVAGSGAYSKIEGFAFLPVTCFSLALTTCIGQNLGAKNYDRARKSAVFGVFCSITLAELIGLGVFAFAPYLISMFNSEPEVVAFGVRQCRVEAFFYCFLALSHCIAGILRGAGKAVIPMIIMFGVWCVLRVTYLTVVLHFWHNIIIVYTAYPLTWTLSSLLFIVYMFKADWLHGLEEKKARRHFLHRA